MRIFTRFIFASILVLTLSADAAPAIKVACVGDSITEGAGLGVNTYPATLGRLLGTNYSVRNFGVSGTTLLRKGDMPYWNQGAFRTATNSSPDIVTIMLGTNDSKPYNWVYKAQFSKDLSDMIDIFAGLPSHPRVFVCLPVPAYAVNFSIQPEVIRTEVIPLIKQTARQKGAMTIDTYNALAGRPDLFPDNIHPNAAGDALIAKTLHGALMTLH